VCVCVCVCVCATVTPRALVLLRPPPAGAVWQAEPGAEAASHIHHRRAQGGRASWAAVCCVSVARASANVLAGCTVAQRGVPHVCNCCCRHTPHSKRLPHHTHPMSQVEKALSIPPAMQKLMFKGLLKNDTDTLGKVRGGRRVHRCQRRAAGSSCSRLPACAGAGLAEAPAASHPRCAGPGCLAPSGRHQEWFQGPAHRLEVRVRVWTRVDACSRVVCASAA
jgi:hypothetical protein